MNIPSWRLAGVKCQPGRCPNTYGTIRVGFQQWGREPSLPSTEAPPESALTRGEDEEAEEAARRPGLSQAVAALHRHPPNTHTAPPPLPRNPLDPGEVASSRRAEIKMRRNNRLEKMAAVCCSSSGCEKLLWWRHSGTGERGGGGVGGG